MSQNEVVEITVLALMFTLIPLAFFVALASDRPRRKRRKSRK